MKKGFLKCVASAVILLAILVFARAGLSYDKMLKKPQDVICSTCHSDKDKFYKTSGHGKAEVTCQMCHDPHGTPPDEQQPAPKKQGEKK